MADDPIDEEFDEEEIDVDIEGEDLEGELVEDLEEVLADDVVLDDDDEDEAAADAALAARPKREDEEEEEEDLNPDDVEADLDAILKDRIAAADDDEEEDEEVVPEPRAPADIAEGVTPKKANEFMCTGCFLLLSPLVPPYFDPTCLPACLPGAQGASCGVWGLGCPPTALPSVRTAWSV